MLLPVIEYNHNDFRAQIYKMTNDTVDFTSFRLIYPFGFNLMREINRVISVFLQKTTNLIATDRINISFYKLWFKVWALPSIPMVNFIL